MINFLTFKFCIYNRMNELADALNQELFSVKSSFIKISLGQKSPGQMLVGQMSQQQLSPDQNGHET